MASAASALSRSAAALMSFKSRALLAVRLRSARYLRSTSSMNDDRECFDPARRSIFTSTSWESVTEVFSFMRLSYYSYTTHAVGILGALEPSALRPAYAFAILNLPLRFCLEAAVLAASGCAEVVKLADTPS